MKNLMQEINKSRSKINSYYSLSISQWLEIYKESEDSFSLISNGFTFGYMQGVKAAKSEIRKKAVLAHE